MAARDDIFKVVLINPPRRHPVIFDHPGFGSADSLLLVYPPVGLMYLAQALRLKMPRVQVSLIDCVAERLDEDQAARRAADMDPDVVGLSALTHYFFDAWQTARSVKRAKADVVVVVGGPHMYALGRETMAHDCFDYGVAGEGEEVFADLCQALRDKVEVKLVPGLLRRVGDEVQGGGAAVVKDLDRIGVPAVDLHGFSPYMGMKGLRFGFGSFRAVISTSRGCPFRCTFCQIDEARYRLRSIPNIIEEIELYTRQGVRDFFFCDHLFNINKKRVIDFCEAVLAKELDIKWSFQGRIDQIDGPMMRLARKAGCYLFSVGIEDCTDAGLHAIKKHVTMRQIDDGLRAVMHNGISCSTNWIIGFPQHQCARDVERLIDTAFGTPSVPNFQLLQCMPGTELHRQAVAEGGLDPLYWTNYVRNPRADFSPPIWERHLTKNELYALYFQAVRRLPLKICQNFIQLSFWRIWSALSPDRS
ncbi:MAG: radical SAM protein [Elusimicrobia bacterium]|nr:radical SAM protein [Elusimicrobiota bacterium]